MKSNRKISKKTSSVIFSLSSLKVKIITTDNEVVTMAQRMLAQMWSTVNCDAVGTAKVKDNKLPIRGKLDLGVIARDAFIFHTDIIAKLTPNVDHRPFYTIDLRGRLRVLSGRGQTDSQPCLGHGRKG